jgi:hypothetical protein
MTATQGFDRQAAERPPPASSPGREEIRERCSQLQHGSFLSNPLTEFVTSRLLKNPPQFEIIEFMVVIGLC